MNPTPTPVKCFLIAVAAMACTGFTRLVLIPMVVLASFAYLAICAERTLEALKEPQLDDSQSNFDELLSLEVAPNGFPWPGA